MLHLVDVTSENVEKDYLTIIKELKAYNTDLAKKDQIVVLTKSDSASKQKIDDATKKLKKLKITDTIGISSVSGENISTLIRRLQDIISINIKNEVIDDQQHKVDTWSP